MNILLTGGNGFIGKNIRESFLNSKYKITAPSSKELNLLDISSVKAYFKDKVFDAVIHCACKPSHRNAINLDNIFLSNMLMFENLVFFKGYYNKFINIGSGAVFDNSNVIVDASEKDIYKNIGQNEHSFSKYVMQKRIDSLPNFLTLNIFGIYGKYEDYAIRFISNAICKNIFKLPISIKQNRRFSYLYIDDLMPVLDYFLINEIPEKAYNLVPNEKYTLFQIASIINDISDSESDIIIASDSMGFEYTGSNTLLKLQYPDIQFTCINEGIKKLFVYYNTNKDQIDKNLLLFDR